MYKAFISYSHQDKQWAEWLHSQLERFRLPSHIAKSLGQPQAIGKIFRDREELSSGQNLAEHIQHALSESENLLVICSPAAVDSPWVRAEIEHFQSLGRRNNIFCLLVEGGDDSFPLPLTQDESGASIVPLAADPRDWADGKRLALLKLVAGMLTLRLDDLVQRDRQRRRQRNIASITAGVALVGITLFGYINALEQRFQRQQAEKLAGFVLDLGTKLEGRLDIESQIAINTEGLNYLQQQDPSELSPESLARVALAYRQLGLAQQAQKLDAKENFQFSLHLLTELAKQDPVQFLFEQGQAFFHLGADYFYNDDYASAAPYFNEYFEINQLLYDADPQNPKFRAELLNASSSLLALELQFSPTSPKTQQLVITTSNYIETIANQRNTTFDSMTFLALSGANDWIGEYYKIQGKKEEYFGALYTSSIFLSEALAQDPANLQLTEMMLESELKLGLITEDTSVKQEYFNKGLARVNKLRVIDEANEHWKEYEVKITSELAKLAAFKNDG